LVSAGDFGMVGPVSNYAPGEQQIRGLELRDEGDIEAFAGTLAEEKRGNVREAFRLSGFCLLIRHAALAKVGLFDERYGIGNFEDDDYCCRMRQAGYRLGIAEDCFVFHFGGRTFEGAGLSGDRFQALLAENRQRYISKWGVHLPGAASAEHQSLALNTRAQEAIAQGNPKEAVQLLHEAITIDPGLALNFAILGQVFSATGKQETAYDCFVRALRIDSSDEVTRRSFREVGDELGRREEVARLLAELNREGEGATDA